MKVKCLNIYNTFSKQYETSSHWLCIGDIYIVLEIYCSSTRGNSYRLVGSNPDKSPGDFDAPQFEIVSTSQPSNWKTFISSNGLISIGPTAWQEPGFWEACYDHDPKALEIYKREARIIFEEEGAW